jgi:hypothetical protein
MSEQQSDSQQLLDQVDEVEEIESQELPDGNEMSDSQDSEDDEMVVTIGDSPAPEDDVEKEKAPEWVRDLRKAHRETQRENRELKQKLEAASQPAVKPVALGQKPKLEDCDYDTEQYDAELQKWYDRKRIADDEAKTADAAQQSQQAAWQERLGAYESSKTQLKVKDFEDAEASILESFDQVQQGIVIQGAENAALVFYALGKNQSRMKELSSIKDPVKFAFAIAKLEKDLKVGTRKAPPAPEKTVSSTGPKSGSVDSTLERLRTEAERTGDYSKVSQYRSQKRKI